MSRMNRIENIAQLRMELVRLKLLEVEQQEKIKGDINGLKRSIAAGAASYSVSYLVQKLVFKNSNPIVKTLISLLVSGATSVMASGKTDALFGKVKDFFKEKFGKKGSSEAFAFDEQKIYE